MQEKLALSFGAANSLTDVMSAMEQGAIAHSIDLHIDHDRMLSEFGVLWMLVRCRLRLERLPVGTLRLETFLRKPTAALSNRDFTLFDTLGQCGTAVQTWVVVDAQERKLVNLKRITPFWSLPMPQPERTDTLRRLILPDTTFAANWTVSSDEIDANGHLNNVQYIRHGEAFAPAGCTGLEVFFDRECFAGETLRLETAETNSFFVRGVKESGEESFRVRFWRDTI